ncbi:hypothetical protein [Nocardia sp. MW-W600-9]
MAFAYIQEGGASDELYLHVWDTEDEADAGRHDCAVDGSYRTTGVVELPDEIPDGLLEAFEELLGMTGDLEHYYSQDHDDTDEDDN